VPTGPPFEQLLAAAQANSGWAFAGLYESLAPRVAGYLRASGVEEPDDLTSEVFLAVFTGLATFRGGEAQFRSWVFTIAHHRIVDFRRAQARRPRLASLDVLYADATSPAAESAEGGALRNVGTGRVERLLDSLAPDQRDVLALRVVADLTVDQVADALGKSSGAVKALQRRALATLRRRLSTEAVPL
jgi:RNA polymerase sigma factor (sigma-70 family)